MKRTTFLVTLLSGILFFTSIESLVTLDNNQGSLLAITTHASPAYEYYGYAPPSNFSALDAHPGAGPRFRYGWEINATTNAFMKNYGYVDNGTCYLDVIGYNDSTNVQVFDITGAEPVLRETFTVNRMQLYNTTIPSKTYFKVVTDKPVAVMVGGGEGYQSGFNLFYPSTDGGYAGKEFILMAIYGRGRQSSRGSPGATIYALDDAKVTIYSDGQGIYWEREMKANTTRTITFLHRFLYRVVSTGRICLGTWSVWTVKVVPSPMGGFKGTYFFVWQDATVAQAGPGVESQYSAIFIISQDRPSHVKVVDFTSDRTMIEKDLGPRSLWFLTSNIVDFLNTPVMVRSTDEIIVMSGTVYSVNPMSTNMDPDVTIVGVRANEPTTLYAVSNIIAFSPKATARLEIGKTTFIIPKGRYAELPKGLITISSNATLVVELISQPATTFPSLGEPEPLQVVALHSWGTYLMTAEGAELTYPPPKTARGEDITLYGAVAGVAVVVATLVFWKKPWKKQ